MCAIRYGPGFWGDGEASTTPVLFVSSSSSRLSIDLPFPQFLCAKRPIAARGECHCVLVHRTGRLPGQCHAKRVRAISSTSPASAVSACISSLTDSTQFFSSMSANV